MESVPASPASHDRRTGWVAAGSVVLACVAVAHAPALGGGFVWDDVILLRDQASMHRVDTAWRLAFSDFFPKQGGEGGGGGYLRPVPVLLNALTWQWTDGSALAFRVSNLLLHLGCVLLLMSLLRRWGLALFPAALGAAFFGLHPASTETVDFISGRTDVLAGFFVLLALHAVVRLTEGGWAALGAAAAAFALALGSKEVALGALPALVLAAPREARRSVAFALGGLALAVIAARLALDVEGPRRLFFSADALPVVLPGLIVFYLGLALMPTSLQVVYTLPGLTSPGLATLLGVVLLVAGGIALVRWRGRARLGLLLAAGTLAPALHILPVSTLVAPRYLYLPLLGGAVLLALAAERLPDFWRRILVALPALGFLLTPLRAADWHSETSLWTAELEVDPTSFTAHQNLGATFAEAGDLDRATHHLTEAARLRPGHDVTLRNLRRLEALRRRERGDVDPTGERGTPETPD